MSVQLPQAREAVTGRIGTTQGRNIEVVRNPHHVIVRDAASPHTPWVLNTVQAAELAEALHGAVNR